MVWEATAAPTDPRRAASQPRSNYPAVGVDLARQTKLRYFPMLEFLLMSEPQNVRRLEAPPAACKCGAMRITRRVRASSGASSNTVHLTTFS
jgi:hypothetical protein